MGRRLEVGRGRVDVSWKEAHFRVVAGEVRSGWIPLYFDGGDPGRCSQPGCGVWSCKGRRRSL